MNQKPTALYAYLSYRDAPAAIDWLAALGFEVVSRQPSEGSTVYHSELRLGHVVIMVASADAPYDMPVPKGRSVGYGLYIRLDNVDEMYERALRSGGTSLFAPENTDWGTRRARVLDPEGYEWSFGSYEPGQRW